MTEPAPIAEAPPEDDPEAIDLDPTEHEAEAEGRIEVRWLETTTPAGIGDRLAAIHPAAWLTLLGALTFTVVFGRLGMQHHRNFGTWAFDMGIYDQSFWLVSRGKSWVTVRGLDFWGHHINLIAIAFAPFYWLGAGPSFLYVVQAGALGAGAIPTYLLARDRLRDPWVGLVFAVGVPDVRADPVDLLGQLPSRGIGRHPVAVRLVVRVAASLAAVLHLAPGCTVDSRRHRTGGVHHGVGAVVDAAAGR